DQPVWKVRSMEFLLERSVSGSRFLMRLLAIFSGLALLLAAVGIYGVISYSVSQRTNEIGIRMALGAQTTDVIHLILKQGLVLTLSGVGTGLLAAFALTRLMQRLLYGVSATDTLTFVFVTVILTGVAMVACLVPARRAAKTDPIIALRYE